MNTLTNDQLLECYLTATTLMLDQDFIELLLIEIQKRDIEFPITPPAAFLPPSLTHESTSILHENALEMRC
ncbi:sporulation histidine kinase inhibitor Sda [Cohnella soli]|uniref:Sporulation histidine kinase inhibitor Sda n=1 Tax=Cohnella soli TaxID=425005 RepID=A0ABW0HL02_9BACL